MTRLSCHGQMLKTKPMLAETETAHVRDMVYVIIHKLKYDDEYDFQALGEDEAMFQEYRYGTPRMQRRGRGAKDGVITVLV